MIQFRHGFNEGGWICDRQYFANAVYLACIHMSLELLKYYLFIVGLSNKSYVNFFIFGHHGLCDYYPSASCCTPCCCQQSCQGGTATKTTLASWYAEDPSGEQWLRCWRNTNSRFRWRPELVGNGKWTVALGYAHQWRKLENLLTVPWSSVYIINSMLGSSPFIPKILDVP